MMFYFITEFKPYETTLKQIFTIQKWNSSTKYDERSKELANVSH